MVAVLVWDAADLPLLERLLEEGRLPALAEVRRRGRWLRLETPGTHFSASAFQTLYSGTHLSEHGLYFAYQWSAAEQRLRHLHQFPGPEDVWERVARGGGRSLVVDPYEARPPELTEGVHLAGWQLQNRASLPSYFAPARIRRDLARRFGRPPLVDEVFGDPSPRYLLRMLRALLAAPARAADAVESLLTREPFDLLWVVFPGVHLGGHWFHDPLTRLAAQPSGPGRSLSADERRRLETGLADIYAATDAALARILAALPPGTEVIVTASVGMGPDPGRLDLVADMLGLVLGEAREAKRPTRRAAGSWIWRLRGGVGTGLRGAVSRPLPDAVLRELTARFELRAIDWARTQAFPLPSDKHGYVRLNLRGREREGIVDPDRAEPLMDEIADGLLTFTDPDGSPAVAGVERTRDVVGPGDGVQRLPDLVVEWSDRPASEVERVESPRHGEIIRRARGTGRSGGHSDDAWALLAPASCRLSEPTRAPHVVDVAATVCALLGVDDPGLSGDPLLTRT